MAPATAEPISWGEAVRASAPAEAGGQGRPSQEAPPGGSKTMRNLAIVVLVLLSAAAVTFLGVALFQS